MRPDLPTGTVTFLLTDVEGSTRLLHELGAEAYSGALAEHRRAIREACATHGGVEVDTQGDSFFFVFPTAAGAVTAAATFTDTLASGPIRVRVGLHTGTPLLTEAGYVGMDVHRAARIAAAGHGGQVLVAASTAALVESQLLDLGEHRFKDLAAPERIFQLGGAEFPPLRTIYRANLPIPANPLVGRKKELVDVMRILRDGARIVSLTGTGGVGKTRFAVAVAGEVSDSFPGGVWFVPLTPLRDAALVLPTLAEVVGAGGDLAGRFGTDECLVLLDNFEQVVDAAPAIAALLGECPGLRVLVTSREALRIAGEREYSLSPLPESPAVELFKQRVNAVAPDVEVEYAIAAEICDRLDRLPLAIELAAARMRALTPAQILGRLSQRLDLLRGGRDADPRQATLRATIDWSHELLSPAEQELLAGFSVFRGGCMLDAAQAVGRSDLDALQSLVEKSLLRFTDGRYWMLETIREYAGERLAEAAGKDELRARHAGWYGDLARDGAMQWFGGTRAEGWEDKVDAEHDNIRAALAELHASGQWADLAATIVAVGGHWDTTGFGAEVDLWLEVVLGEPQEDRLQARLLGLAGRRASFRGDRAAALAYASRFGEVAHRLGDPMAIASATFDLARAHEVAGDPVSALDEYRRAAELFHGVSRAASRQRSRTSSVSSSNSATTRARASTPSRRSSSREAPGIRTRSSATPSMSPPRS